MIDPKDKLESKLYQVKISDLLNDPENHLLKCSTCNNIFAERFYDCLECERAQLQVNKKGHIYTRHDM